MLGRRIGLVFLVFPLHLAAVQGLIQTRSGEGHTGHIRIQPEGVTVVNSAQGYSVTVALTNLLLLELNDRVGKQWREILKHPTNEQSHWQYADLGSNWQSGASTNHNGRVQLVSSGTAIGDRVDSCGFYYQRTTGVVEIATRLLYLEGPLPSAEAGLMLRGSLDANSPHVSLLATPRFGGAGGCEYRLERDGESIRGNRFAVNAPCWLKLRREDSEVEAWISSGGTRWKFLEKIQIRLPDQYYAGIAVAGARSFYASGKFEIRKVRTSFDQLRTGRWLKFGSFEPRVILRSGSIMRGEIEGLDDRQLLFAGTVSKALSRPAVGAILLDWPLESFYRSLRVGRAGALLSNGEFVEGDVRWIGDNTVQISSVLFGLRALRMHGDVLALVLGKADYTEAAYEIKTEPGSRYRASRVTLGNNELIIHENTLGVLTVPIYELAELRWRPLLGR